MLEEKQTTCTYVFRHKDGKAQCVDHVATPLTTNVILTHTSKTRQEKRTQMVAAGRFTVRTFVIFFKLLRIERKSQPNGRAKACEI